MVALSREKTNFITVDKDLGKRDAGVQSTSFEGKIVYGKQRRLHFKGLQTH